VSQSFLDLVVLSPRPKKKGSSFFDHGLTGCIEKQTAERVSSKAAATVGGHIPVSIYSVEPGSSLAVGDLGWGTLYLVNRCSILFYGIWKLMAVNIVL
jgi:hypothetical protein